MSRGQGRPEEIENKLQLQLQSQVGLGDLAEISYRDTFIRYTICITIYW